MNVAALMSSEPVVVGALDTAQEAARRMYAHFIMTLPVLEGGRLVGMVTDRDLAMRVVAAGKSSQGTQVREIMTRAPATCRCDDTIEAALEGMLSRCVRHLVVVDDHGAVAGVLSFEDLLAHEESGAMALRVLRQVGTLRREMDETFKCVQP